MAYLSPLVFIWEHSSTAGAVPLWGSQYSRKFFFACLGILVSMFSSIPVNFRACGVLLAQHRIQASGIHLQGPKVSSEGLQNCRH